VYAPELGAQRMGCDAPLPKVLEWRQYEAPSMDHRCHLSGVGLRSGSVRETVTKHVRGLSNGENNMIACVQRKARQALLGTILMRGQRWRWSYKLSQHDSGKSLVSAQPRHISKITCMITISKAKGGAACLPCLVPFAHI
jgi:hypothetical protein